MSGERGCRGAETDRGWCVQLEERRNEKERRMLA